MSHIYPCLHKQYILFWQLHAICVAFLSIELHICLSSLICWKPLWFCCSYFRNFRSATFTCCNWTGGPPALYRCLSNLQAAQFTIWTDQKSLHHQQLHVFVFSIMTNCLIRVWGKHCPNASRYCWNNFGISWPFKVEKLFTNTFQINFSIIEATVWLIVMVLAMIMACH